MNCREQKGRSRNGQIKFGRLYKGKLNFIIKKDKKINKKGVQSLF